MFVYSYDKSHYLDVQHFAVKSITMSDCAVCDGDRNVQLSQLFKTPQEAQELMDKLHSQLSDRFFVDGENVSAIVI